MTIDVLELRERHGWTQQELAHKLDTSVRNVSGWETGKHKPSRAYRKLLEKLNKRGVK